MPAIDQGTLSGFQAVMPIPFKERRKGGCKMARLGLERCESRELLAWSAFGVPSPSAVERTETVNNNETFVSQPRVNSFLFAHLVSTANAGSISGRIGSVAVDPTDPS